MELSVILPCRNEEAALGECIRDIREVMDSQELEYEIIVSDCSTDSSPQIARDNSVKLVKHDRIGYGAAYLEAFKHAGGRYIFMADADCTYEFSEIPRFLKELREGSDLVIGDRFRGVIREGAMPWLHRHIGNPALSGIFRLLFGSDVGDVHCGMRAISRQALDRLRLKTTGMEFATEMLVRAAEEKLRIAQLPIDYHPRNGESKLSSISDGWRHLRFMLMLSPDKTFVVPALASMLSGAAVFGASVLSASDWVGAALGCFLFILGYETITLGLYVKAHMKSAGFLTSDKLLDYVANLLSLETGIIAGLFLILSSGSVFLLSPSSSWAAPVTLTLAILGTQTVFNSLYVSMALVETENSQVPD